MLKIKLSDLPQLLQQKYIKPDDEYPIEAGVAARIYTAYENSRKREESLQLKVAALEMEIKHLKESSSLYSRSKIVYG